MLKENKASSLLPMVVTEGVTVNVLPNEQHEYLMTTKEVAKGYGTTAYSIRQNKVRLGDELVEGKHYVLAVTISHTGLPSALKTAHNAVLWTKRGIVRLGFAMRSPRAKLFRDWAEQLIIQLDERRDLFGAVPVKALPKRRNHNRLTSDRLIKLLTLASRIEDSELRSEIVEQLNGGH